MADHPGMTASRPMPEIDAASEPFWRGAREGRLMLPRCTACGSTQFPPELACTLCGAAAIEFVEASGRATLYTWTVCHPPLLPYFGARAPWAVAAVELEEGVRMTTRIVDVPVDEYEIGMPLLADFEKVDDEVSLVVFRRA